MKDNPYFNTKNEFPSFEEITDNTVSVIISMVLHEYQISYDDLVSDNLDTKHLMARYMACKLLTDIAHVDKYLLLRILHKKSIKVIPWSLNRFDVLIAKDPNYKELYDKLIGYLTELYTDTDIDNISDFEYIDRIKYIKT